MMVCPFRIVVGCVDGAWMLQLTLHNYWLRDALPMDILWAITSHMRVVERKTGAWVCRDVMISLRRNPMIGHYVAGSELVWGWVT